MKNRLNAWGWAVVLLIAVELVSLLVWYQTDWDRNQVAATIYAGIVIVFFIDYLEKKWKAEAYKYKCPEKGCGYKASSSHDFIRDQLKEYHELAHLKERDAKT